MRQPPTVQYSNFDIIISEHKDGGTEWELDTPGVQCRVIVEALAENRFAMNGRLHPWSNQLASISSTA
jgi:hypothetical protein